MFELRINKDYVLSAAKLIHKAKNIVIVPHTGPDGDAMGSSLALFEYMKLKDKNPVVLAPNNYPGNLNFLPNNSDVLIFIKNKIKAKKILKEADLIFILDHNTLKRSGDLGMIIESLDTKKIMIDHHPFPEDITDICFSDTNMCSTCEFVYEFIAALGDANLINSNISECLYTGIVTDTGGLSYNSSNPQTYNIISDLLKKGLDKNQIHTNIFDTFTMDRMKMLGYCLDGGLEVIEKFHTSIICLRKEDLSRFNYKDGDTEGFVNRPLSIHGMLISVIFMEKDDVVKISFRSKGDVPINKIAEKYFNGGGHTNAAGGKVTCSIDEAIENFKKLLPEFYSSLNI